MTDEDINKDCIYRMGPELGRLFHRLLAEFHKVLVRWRSFRSLYGSDSDRIKLLNAADAQFFGIVQQVLWESTLLGVAHFVDKSTKTVSLARIPPLVTSTDRRKYLASELEQVVKTLGFAKTWRDQYLAHKVSESPLEVKHKSYPELPGKV